jgi:hypothetical protein
LTGERTVMAVAFPSTLAIALAARSQRPLTERGGG